MAVLVICKFEDDSIKSEGLILQTIFFFIINLLETFSSLKANNSAVKNPIWLEIELVRDFMTVLVLFKPYVPNFTNG